MGRGKRSAMSSDRIVAVAGSTGIPFAELRFSASRSGGPGGQHVNTTSSRVTLYFDVAASPSLSAEQKRTVAQRLHKRISREGVLVMHAQSRRSQAANRALLVERFAELLSRALTPRKPRKPTRPGKAAVARRLEAKRRRAELKASRRGREP